MSLGSRIIRYVRDGRTDRQTDRWTDGQKQHLLPSTVGGIIKIVMRKMSSYWILILHGHII